MCVKTKFVKTKLCLPSLVFFYNRVFAVAIGEPVLLDFDT